jgi:glycine cleavage system H protein
MEFPDDLKYTREHEWLLVEGSVATVGITAFAEQQLGDVVFIELPAVGDKVVKDEAMGVVESVKAVSDVYAPVSGTVLGSTTTCPRTELVNESLRRRLDGEDRDERSH